MTPIPAATTKMCPLLTAGTFSRPQSGLVDAQGNRPEPEGVGCQGPQCALFVQIHEQDDAGNKIVSGQCALALIPTSINLAAQLAMQAQRRGNTPPNQKKG